MGAEERDPGILPRALKGRPVGLLKDEQSHQQAHCASLFAGSGYASAHFIDSEFMEVRCAQRNGLEVMLEVR